MYYQALINKKFKYREDTDMFQDRRFITTTDIDGDEVYVEEKTYEAYQRLKNFLQTEKNIKIGICSSYRDLDTQQQVWNDFVLQYGEDYTKKTVSPVGCSEHHTGLCVDLSVWKDEKFLIEHKEIMENLAIYQEIVPYLSRFGFILRYPKGKEQITGYAYEPWHIRYVGVSLARKIYEKRWTLEEYYQNLSGVLVVNKEPNMTSRDVVNLVEKYFYTKKVGHTGTLDPLATGVLVVTIGKYTRISELLTATYKEYIAKVKLGIETDTLDITGVVLKQTDFDMNLPLLKTLESFQKTYMQEVPLYSAVKVKGKKLYEYAREKKQVELPKKEVTIRKIELLSQNEDSFTFRCLVSKGTYIRSLIRDIGKELGAFATMTELQRTRQGNFSLEDSVSISDIKNGQAHLLDLREALRDYPQVIVTLEDEKKVKNGQTLNNPKKIKGPCVIVNNNGCAIAVYKGVENKLTAWKVLTTTGE